MGLTKQQCHECKKFVRDRHHDLKTGEELCYTCYMRRVHVIWAPSEKGKSET